MKMHFILPCIYFFSFYAFAECPVDGISKDGKLKSAENFSNKLVDHQCFSFAAVEEFLGERYSDPYCAQYIKCSKMIENQIGGKDVLIEAEYQNARPPVEILSQNEKIKDKVLNAGKKNLQTMSDMLAIVPSPKVNEICPKAYDLFNIPKEDGFNPDDEYLAVKGSDIRKMRADSAQKWKSCLVNGKFTKNCFGFNKIKSLDQLTSKALDKIKSICKKTPSFQQINFFDQRIDAKRIETGLEIESNIDYDLKEGYEKYLKETQKMKLFSRKEERKQKIAYFTALEAVRCKSGIKYHEKKHGKNPIGYFYGAKQELYFMTNEQAKKENDSIVSERAYKDSGSNSDSLYSSLPSSNSQTGGSKVATVVDSPVKQETGAVVENTNAAARASSQQIANNNQNQTSGNPQPSSQQYSNQLAAENANTNYVTSNAPSQVPTSTQTKVPYRAPAQAEAVTSNHLSEQVASTAATPVTSSSNSADTEISKLQDEVNSLKSKLSDQASVSRSSFEQQSNKLSAIASNSNNEQIPQDVSKANVNDGNLNKFEQPIDFNKEGTRSSIPAPAQGADKSATQVSTNTQGGQSSKSALVLTKIEELTPEKANEMINQKEPIYIEENGMIKEIILATKDGKVVLGDDGKPVFTKIVKGKVGDKKFAGLIKVKESGRAPAAVVEDSAADLKKIEDQKLRDRAEYLKLKQLTNHALEETGK